MMKVTLFESMTLAAKHFDVSIAYISSIATRPETSKKYKVEIL